MLQAVLVFGTVIKGIVCRHIVVELRNVGPEMTSRYKYVTQVMQLDLRGITDCACLELRSACCDAIDMN